MSLGTRFFSSNNASSENFDARDDHGGFFPGDRILPVRRRSRAGLMARGVVALGVVGGGWVAFNDPPRAARWWSVVTATVAPMIEAVTARSTPPPVKAEAERLPALDRIDAAPTSAALIEAPPVPVPRAVETPVETPAVSAEKPEPLPPLPPRVPSTDPLQMRAEAVGLHPDLSRVLLSQLTAVDYKNAGVAIRTALAKTADTAFLIWPEQGRADDAQFKVQFVLGAPGDCRRYVVIVAKAGWLTTALPMEKCGAELVAAKRG
jgi:hypothetical protein